MKKMKNITKKTAALLLALLMTVTVFGSSFSVSAAIKPGTKSSAVTTMQKKLIALGYLSVSADGSYGSKTKAAVKAFETAYKLKADGSADDTMLAKLDSVYTNAARIKVTGSKVNIRSGAGTKYKKLGTVKKNASYIALGSKKVSSVTWYKFRYGTKTCWISGSYVKYTAAKTTATTTNAATTTTTKATSGSTTAKATTKTTAKTTATTAKPATTVRVGTVTDASVNARSGAGMSNPCIVVLKKGYSFTITGSKQLTNTWYSFNYNGKTVWVSGKCVSVKTQTAATTTTKPTTTTTQSTTKPSDDTLLSKTDASVTTTTTTTTTTASTTTTTTKATTTTTTKAPDEVIYGRVDVNTSLNVRKNAGTSYDKVGSLGDGVQVTILDKTSVKGWYKVTDGKITGWVDSDYIDIITTPGPSTSIAFSASYIYVDVGSTVKFNFGPGVTYSVKNSSVASVSSSGEVKGLTPGLTTLTAKSGSKSDTTELVVLRAPYELTDEQKNMGISEKGVKFIANWEGGGSTDPKIDNGKTLIFRPYKDVSGYWTIGYGHAKTSTASKSWSEETAISAFAADIKARVGDEIELSTDKPYLTKDEAMQLLLADLNNGVYVSTIRKWADRNGVKLTQNQFDALVSFVYNLGTSYFSSDTKYFYLKSAIICHRCGDDADRAQVTDGFSRYIKSGGKNLKGLWYRRMNEAEMFTDGDYKIDRTPKFTPPTNISWS